MFAVVLSYRESDLFSSVENTEKIDDRFEKEDIFSYLLFEVKNSEVRMTKNHEFFFLCIFIY